jgi:superoxide dismutase, Cu-Zn family
MRLINNRFQYFSKHFSKHFRYGLLALLMLLLSTTIACTRLADLFEPADTKTDSSQATAAANLVGTALAPTISGQITLVETPTGLKMQGQLAKVPPGMHGFHIHEGSSCADEGKAAGGHFNPRKVAHGHLPSMGFEKAHAGDFGNLQASATGAAAWNLELPGLTLTSGEYAVANRTFILHAKPDDLSQPTGNAGDRIACGMIQPVAQSQGMHNVNFYQADSNEPKA